MAELDPEKLNTENKEVENKEETTAEESKESQPVEAKVEETKKDEKGVETLETEEGVYTKKEADVQKNFVYKNASGKVDGVNLKLADAIENARKNFVKNYRSNRLGANISVGIFAFFIVATAVVYFTLSQTENKTLYNCLMWPFFGLAIVALVCFLILSNVGKKKSYKEIGNYLDIWTDSFISDAYVGKPGVDNVTYSIDGKVDDWSIINTHYFATIDSIESRSHVVMDYYGKALCDTEVSISVPLYNEFVNRIALEKVIEDPNKVEEVNEEQPVAEKDKKKKANNGRSPYVGGYGKFLSYEVNAKNPNDYLIVVRKVKDTYLPTNVHGLTRFDNLAGELLSNDYVIWASDEKFVREILKPAIIEAMQKMTPNSVLQDWFFTFNKSEAAFMLNYGSAIMELPMYDKVQENNVEQYPHDVELALTVFKTANDTRKLGERLAKSLAGGEVILAYAPMGVGKTCFAQGLAKGLGIDRVVNSPTFNMIKVYRGTSLTFYHVDAYRLENKDENRDIGLTELLNDPSGVCYIEWPEYIVDEFENVKDFITIELTMNKDGTREAVISHGRTK